MGCHFLHHSIFLIQRLNPSLLCHLHCQANSYHWATWETLNRPDYGEILKRIPKPDILAKYLLMLIINNFWIPCAGSNRLLSVYQFSSGQLLSRVWLSATPWIAACQASLSITNSQSLLKHLSIESVMPSSHLVLCRPLLLLPPIPPSIRVFSNELTLRMRWPKYWSFSFSLSPSNEHPGLISFRMDWLNLLAVQGTLKNLLQHHSSKASIFWYSAFFTVQLSHPYMTM